jgi:hypothetical protein
MSSQLARNRNLIIRRSTDLSISHRGLDFTNGAHQHPKSRRLNGSRLIRAVHSAVERDMPLERCDP